MEIKKIKTKNKKNNVMNLPDDSWIRNSKVTGPNKRINKRLQVKVHLNIQLK